MILFTNAAITTTEFTVTPDDIGMVGIHTVQIKLTDACQTIESYNFYVEVTNTAPYWDPDQDPLPSIAVPMNTMFTHKITGFKDDENHPIFMDVWLIINGVRNSIPSPSIISKVPPYNI